MIVANRGDQTHCVLILTGTNTFLFIFSATLSQLLDMIQDLRRIREQYRKQQDERKLIMAHLGIHNEEDEQDLIPAFRKYVVNNEERIHGLREQIKELEEMVREKSATLQTVENNHGNYCALFVPFL